MTFTLPEISIIMGKRVYPDGRVYVGKDRAGEEILFIVSPNFLSGDIDIEDSIIEGIDIKFNGIGLRTIGEDGRVSIGRPYKDEWALLLFFKEFPEDKKRDIEKSLPQQE